MRYLSLLFALLFTFPMQRNVNAYMSPTFEDYFEGYIPKVENKEPLNDIWDVSDLDLSCVDKNRKLIAFTFDDAPFKTLESILTVFAAYNENNPDCKASATVFYNGCHINEFSFPLLHTAYMLGFEVGNHTQSHFDLTHLKKAEIQTEINKTDKLLSCIDGKEYHLLRAPFGHLNEDVKSCANAPLIHWSVDTLDWTGASAEDIYNRVWTGRSPGGIVLMHDGYEHTVSALKRLLPDLKADGYQVVSVSAMAKSNGCELKKGKVYMRAKKA